MWLYPFTSVLVLMFTPFWFTTTRYLCATVLGTMSSKFKTVCPLHCQFRMNYWAFCFRNHISSAVVCNGKAWIIIGSVLFEDGWSASQYQLNLHFLSEIWHLLDRTNTKISCKTAWPFYWNAIELISIIRFEITEKHLTLTTNSIQ